MTKADDKERAVAISSVPQMDTGAPAPVVIANESQLFVAFLHNDGRQGDYLKDPNDDRGADPAWDALVDRYTGSTPFIDGDWDTRERVVVIEAVHPVAHRFGPPNDETIHGHPLAGRGLESYAAFIVENSSWIRELEQINQVHLRHDSAEHTSLVHYIVTFHDSTFECIARSITLSAHPGPPAQAVANLAARLETD